MFFWNSCFFDAGLCFAIDTSHKKHTCPGASGTTLTSQRPTHSVPISFKTAKYGTGSAVSCPQCLQRAHTSELPGEASGLCSVSVISDPQVKQMNFPPDIPSPFCVLAAGLRGNAVNAGSSQSTAHSRASHRRLGQALHHRRDRWRGPNFLPCVLTKRQAP